MRHLPSHPGFATVDRMKTDARCAEGLVEGLLKEGREICLAVVRKWHPRADAKVWQAIANCTDPDALKEVTVNAAEWDTRAILGRLGGH